MPLNATYQARSSDLQPISPNDVHYRLLEHSAEAHASYSESRYSLTTDKSTVETRFRSLIHHYFFCSGPIFCLVLVTVQ